MNERLVAELRDWAEQARVAFEGQAQTAWHQGEHRTAEVAALAARTFADLRMLTRRQLAAERARLAAAFEEAENKRKAIAQEHGDWTMIAHYHDERAGKALAAMANFDAATKGGE